MRVSTYRVGLLLGAAACASPGPSPGQPPTAMLVVTPRELTNAAEATFQFTADRLDASFLCSLDQGEPAACASPYVVTVLDGAHTLEILAVAADGRRSPGAISFAWTVDTRPPETAIAGGPPASSDTSEAAFGFASTEDGTFQCQIDQGAFVACSSGQRFTRLAQGAHVFHVKAIDKAGNEDPTPASAAWTVNLLTPETSIDQHPAGLTTATAATFAFSGDAPGSSFACALDDAAFSPCSSPVAVSQLPDGVHTFQVRATSADGVVDPTPASVTWTIDTTGPTTTITSGAEAGATGAAVSFTFTSEAPATFECKLDSAAFGACSGAGRQDLADLPDGLHGFHVRATDPLGNIGPIASRSFTVDTVRPVVTISAPADGAIVQPADSLFFSVSKPASLTCQVDAGALLSCTAPAFRLPAPGDGLHLVTIQATDTAGNVGMATRQVIVDGTRPIVTLASPAEGQLVGGTVSFQFSADEPIETYLCRLDDEPFFSSCAPGTSRTLAGGAHTFRVYGIDRARNQSDVIVRSFSVDNLKPRITISSPTDGEFTSRSGSVVFSATKNATTACKLTGATVFTPCTSPLPFTLPDGIATITVVATDAVGNTDTATRQWNVFTPVPIVTITSPPESALTGADVTFQFSTNEAVSGYLCRLDQEPDYTACTPGLTRTLATGSHTMRIHGVDLAGLAGPDEVRTFRVDASLTFVEIEISNTCVAFLAPSEITVPADQTLNLRFHNDSHDFPVSEINMSYGGGFLDLLEGQSWTDPIPHCTVRGIDEWADVSTPCAATPMRLLIHCLP